MFLLHRHVDMYLYIADKETSQGMVASPLFLYLSFDSFCPANANLILNSYPSRPKLSTWHLPEGKAYSVALLLVVEAADVVDVEEELAEVAEEEGEDEQDEDARQLSLAARRRRRHGRVGVLRQIEVG